MLRRKLSLGVFLLIVLAACAPQGDSNNPSTNNPPIDNSPTNYRTTEYMNSWGLEAINAAAAYEYLDGINVTKRGDGVIVAVSDGGIDAAHIDLDDNITSLGADQGNFDNGDQYDSSHGSHVAGIAAAEKNDRGVHGVAYQAKVTSVIDEFEAISYAAQKGATVINMSWGIGGSNSDYPLDQAELDAGLNFLAEAVQKDAVLVTTLANSSEDRHGYPVGFVKEAAINDQMIIVGAIDQNRQIASFGCGQSQEAELEHCMVAPGAAIVSVASKRVGEDEVSDVKINLDGAEYFRWDGSSMAAPHVAGAAALLKSLKPSLTAKEIVRILLDTATPLHAAGEDTTKLSSTFGHGLLNLEAAVKAVVAP